MIKSKTKDNSLACSYAIFAEVLNKKEIKSQQELSSLIGCNKAHTSRTILKMQNDGLVQKNDNITLTEKGKQYAQTVIKNKKTLIDSLFKDVKPDDKEIFIKVLNKILENSKILEG